MKASDTNNKNATLNMCYLFDNCFTDAMETRTIRISIQKYLQTENCW